MTRDHTPNPIFSNGGCSRALWCLHAPLKGGYQSTTQRREMHAENASKVKN
jgi:hypothetical protein